MATDTGHAIDANSSQETQPQTQRRAALPEGWWDGSVGGLIARWRDRALKAEARASQLESELAALRLRAAP